MRVVERDLAACLGQRLAHVETLVVGDQRAGGDAGGGLALAVDDHAAGGAHDIRR